MWQAKAARIGGLYDITAGLLNLPFTQGERGILNALFLDLYADVTMDNGKEFRAVADLARWFNAYSGLAVCVRNGNVPRKVPFPSYCHS
jgi:hypothetical protein